MISLMRFSRDKPKPGFAQAYLHTLEDMLITEYSLRETLPLGPKGHRFHCNRNNEVRVPSCPATDATNHNASCNNGPPLSLHTCSPHRMCAPTETRGQQLRTDHLAQVKGLTHHVLKASDPELRTLAPHLRSSAPLLPRKGRPQARGPQRWPWICTASTEATVA